MHYYELTPTGQCSNPNIISNRGAIAAHPTPSPMVALNGGIARVVVNDDDETIARVETNDPEEASERRRNWQVGIADALFARG